MAIIKFGTTYGEVSFHDAMVDFDGTNPEEGVIVYVDDEYVGELGGFNVSDLEDCRVNEIEEILTIYCLI